MPLQFVRPLDSDESRLSRLSLGDKLQIMASLAPAELQAVDILVEECILRHWRMNRELLRVESA